MKAHLTAAVVLALSACGCGSKTANDGGQMDASMVDDAGLDAGSRDAGGVDAGQDAGRPPQLTVTRALPPRGSTAGGTSVLLEGSGFLRLFATTGSTAKPLTTLKVGGNTVQDFQIIDDETIELRTPPGLSGRASVSLKNPNGTFVCTNCFTYFDELVLASLAPVAGPLAGGTEVSLQGQGFTADTEVLFGTQSSPRVTLVSSTQLKAVAPRGVVADLVDVTAYNKNGSATQRRAFRYFTSTRLDGVAPLTGPVAGGTVVVLTGAGFEGATAVRFGTVKAPSFTVDSDTQLTVTSPAASGAGTVELVVDTPQGSATRRGAFTYFVPAGAFSVAGVFPHVVTPGEVVTVTGQGLDQGALSVSFGGQVAQVGATTFSTAQVTVPSRGAAPRVSDLVVNGSTVSGAVTWRMQAATLSPTRGPAVGGTPVTATGSAFPPSALVWVGALSASSVSVSNEGELHFTTGRGSGGLASDVIVRDAADVENEARWGGGFEFVEAVAIGRVQPERGAIAGGTLVTVLGAGFGDGTLISFGNSKAKDVKVVDSHSLTCRIPKADVGVVDVSVTRAGVTDTLNGGFAYYDPRSIAGGLSGGPLVGTVNVTVLDATPGFYGAPVPLATVVLGVDPTTPFQGVTDARGQLTFSDPALVKAQTVTVFKDGYQSATVTAVSAENLTVFVSRTAGGEASSGPPPPGVPASTIAGRVTGFKSPRPLGSEEVLEARVFVAQGSLYSGPPFGGAPNKSRDTWRVTSDGGKYLVYSGAGLRAVYAVLGVWNATTMTFTPLTLGVRRGVTTSPDNPATGQDIVLDLQLDLSAPVTIDSPVSFPGTNGPEAGLNSVYAWLDLGAEGFIPNPNNWDTGLGDRSSVSSKDAQLKMPNLPQLDGSNFIFLNEARSSTGDPVSYFFRRQAGDVRGGVTIGPMLPAPNLTAPTTQFTGTVSWTLDPGGVPDLHELQILRASPFGYINLWDVVVPGTQTLVVLPQAAMDKLVREEQGHSLILIMYSSRSPKFAYNQWTYDTLSGVSWSAYTFVMSKSFTP